MGWIRRRLLPPWNGSHHSHHGRISTLQMVCTGRDECFLRFSQALHRGSCSLMKRSSLGCRSHKPGKHRRGPASRQPSPCERSIKCGQQQHRWLRH